MAERLDLPFTSRAISLGGHDVHYIDEGSGPVLLLLHGNPTWSYLYRNLIPELSRRFRCIAPDYPGFGLSRASQGYDFKPRSHSEMIESFIRHLKLKDILLMVQDWGGPIGLGVAGRNPGLFQGFILGNTWAWPVDGDFHFELFSWVLGGPLGCLLIRHLNLFVNGLIPAGVKRLSLSKEVMEMYRLPFRRKAARAPMKIFPREIIKSRDYLAEVHAGLTKINHLPALILWGDKDIAFRAKEREAFETIFSNHETRILKGAGHYIQEDAPMEIIAAINSWAK